MKKSSTRRVNKMRAEAEAKGWKRREYYATINEHEKLKKHLQEIRQCEK